MSFRRRWNAVCAAAILALLSFAAPAVAGDAFRLPLSLDLVVTSASHFGGQDYEVLRTVRAMDEETVTFVLHRSAPLGPGSDELETLSIVRVVRVEDLRSANRINPFFQTEDPEKFPGSTATQASTALLAKLKSGAATPIVFGFGTGAGPLGMWGARKYYRGKLTLVEPRPVPFSVLLNGVRSDVPAIHVKGRLAVGDDAADAEFWFLDEPDNAQVLRWTFKDTIIHVVRIDTGEAATGATVESALASDACRAELYGVYFDTGSAALLDASAAAIAEVAALLQGSPDWRVTIEGHTDDIGSDEDNLRLSQARAEAVRSALVDAGIAGDRLTAAGFGEAQPIEGNDTVEGRSRNRRVELARECP